MTSRSRRSSGQSLVEFALIFPIFMLLLLAVFDLGRAVFVYNGLTNAAREGVRLAVVNQNEDLVSQRATAAAFGNGLSNSGDPGLVDYYKQLPDQADPTNNDVCTTISVGCMAVVRAQSEWSPITPLIGNIIGPITFEGRSELPIEFVCPNPNIPEFDLLNGSECPRQP